MLIALSGKMGSGKSTVFSILGEYLEDVRLVKFAQPLYDIQSYVYERLELPLHGKDRKLLQWLGTDFMRMKDENQLCNLWKRQAKLTLDLGCVVITDDCRFENEAQAVAELGGLILRIEAPENVRADRIHLTGTEHPSERGFPSHYVDYTIGNTGNISDLELQVEKFLKVYCDL